MAKYLPFLKSVWTVFSIDPQNILFYPTWMDRWVDEQVYFSLGEFTSVDELASLCETKGVTTKSFEKTIKNLNEYWSQFSPRAKDALIRIIKIHKLEDLINFELQLTYEEQEELKIQWDISDILYFEKKQEAINLCKEFGLDLEKGEINFSKAIRLTDSTKPVPEMMDNCTRIILSALRYKLESDLAVTSVVAPDNLRRYTEKIEGRLNREYMNLLYDLRVPFNVFFTSLHPDWDGLLVAESTELNLKAFKQEFKRLLLKIPEIQPNSVVYIRVQEMIRSSS